MKLVLVLVLLVLPAVAICTQILPARLTKVRFSDTDQSHAWGLIRLFAGGTCEQRFGYPSGYFMLDEGRSQEPRKLFMREAQPSGAITDGCAAQLGAMGASGFEEGFGAGCMMMFVVGVVGAPFFVISFADRFFRRVLRSRVIVTITKEGRDSVADFAFYGPGGYSLRNRYAKVFAAPELPASLSPPAHLTVSRPSPSTEAAV